MAVSKRLRFEILKRDGFKCKYCHGSEVLLTVDHVKPKALGGTDNPSNLVASCDDCNAGKTSTLPGGANVDDVEEDVIRWTRAMKRAGYLASEKNDAMNEYRDAFKAVWDRWRTADKATVPLPNNWGQLVDQFYAADLPDWTWERIVQHAMNASIRGDRFTHACDLAWKKVAALQQQARADLAGSESLDWAKAEKSAVITAADYVWRSSWMAAHGEDPVPEDALAARARAVELYPEELSAGDLLTAMQASAEYRIDDLEEALEHERGLYEDEPWTRERYKETWHEQWRAAKDDGVEPTLDERVAFERHMDAAVCAGYDGMIIGHAAFEAGSNRSPLLLTNLDCAREILERLEREDEEAAQVIGLAGAAWYRAFKAASGGKPTDEELRKVTESIHPWALRIPFDDIAAAAAQAGGKREFDVASYLPVVTEEVPF